LIDRKHSMVPAERRSLIPVEVREPGCDEKL
jgi:hypothetical protein